jgi:NTE family protein
LSETTSRWQRAIVLAATIAWLSFAQDPERASAADAPTADPPGARPKIGLVLSGGGARGAAHVGVIEVLEELRIPIDYVAGTSMGAVVGGLYASGIEIGDLRVLLAELPWEALFTDRTPRRDLAFRRKQDDRNFLSDFSFGISDWKIRLPSGLIQGQKLELTLGLLTLPVATVRNFDDLMIPFRAVATDIVSGEAVVLAGGDLADVIRASMAIPGAFAPVEIDGRLLVDGGSTMNLPVEVAREMGADIVIAVDISTPLRSRAEIVSALSVTGQTVTMQIQQNTTYQVGLLDEDDFLIRPELGSVSTMAFDRVLEAADMGRTAGWAVADFLSRLSLHEAAWERYRSSLVRPSKAPPVIGSVRIDNDSVLSDAVIRSRIEVPIGEPLDYHALAHDIDILYGLDVFDHVNFRIDRLPTGGDQLVILTRARATGRNRVRFGVQLETDFVSNGLFDLGVNVTRVPFNSLAAEWRNELFIGQDPALSTEFWQPLDAATRWFVAPVLRFRSRTLGIFDDTVFELLGIENDGGNELAEYRFNKVEGNLAVGRQLGQWGEVRAGLEYGYAYADRVIGLPGLFGTAEETIGQVFARIAVDTLDDAVFPRSGTLGVAQANFGLEAIGASDNYQDLFLALSHARSWGENTLLFESEAALSFEDEDLVGNLYTLGGFLRLSGLKPNERIGTDLLFFRIRGYRRIARLGLLSFTLPAYVGLSLEGGNTWFGTSQISIDSFNWGGSLYFALDTPLAPIYIAYGNTNGNRNAAYFFMGQVF